MSKSNVPLIWSKCHYWVNLVKICILWCFSYISQLKSLQIGYFTQTSLPIHLLSTYLTKTNIFLKLHTSHYTIRIVNMMPPKILMGGGMCFWLQQRFTWMRRIKKINILVISPYQIQFLFMTLTSEAQNRDFQQKGLTLIP